MMVRQLNRSGCVAVVLAWAATAVSAQAQVVGTFSWQTQPYCNVLTLTIIQQGGVYQLAGSDNLCGVATAPVTGTAVVTGGGAGVAFGLAVALPTGRTGHLSASVDLATVSGVWTDADGNTGTFAFGATAAGAPRPAPASTVAITTAQLSPTVYAGTGSAATVARSDHDHDARYYTQLQTDAAIAVKSDPLQVLISNGGPTPTLDFASANARTVTTSRAGRLSIQMFFQFSVTCSVGVPSLYLLLDGAAVPSSLVGNGGSYQGYLIGTSSAVVAAGPHNVGFGIECPGAATLTGGSISTPGAATVTVIP